MEGSESVQINSRSESRRPKNIQILMKNCWIKYLEKNQSLFVWCYSIPVCRSKRTVSRLEDKLNEAQGLRRFDPRLSFQPSSNKVLPLEYHYFINGKTTVVFRHRFDADPHSMPIRILRSHPSFFLLLLVLVPVKGIVSWKNIFLRLIIKLSTVPYFLYRRW